MRSFLFLYFVLNATIVSSKVENEQLKKSIDALAASYLQNPQNVGLSIGIVKDGKQAVFCYGVKNKISREPIQPSTIFEIGSITKIFTSLLLAKEIENGRMGLDNPIKLFFDPGTISKGCNNINLKQLATHSSGLPRLPDNFWATVTERENPYKAYGPDHLLDYLSGGKPDPTGIRYGYSNVGFGLLGYILSTRNNCTYDLLVKRNVCSPLALNNTAVNLIPQQIAQLASGHSKGKKVKNWDFSEATAGQGALKSNTMDMIKFINANIYPKSHRMYNAVTQTQKVYFRDNYSGVQTGLGWHIGKFSGEKYIEHTGGTGGYRSFIGICPETGLGIIILSNSDEEVANLGIEILKLLNQQELVIK